MITTEELRIIDEMWEDEGDLSRRALVDLYYEVKGKRLPWDEFKHAKYDADTIALITQLCVQYHIPFDLVSKLLISVDNNKFFTRSAFVSKEIDRILNEGWLHYDAISEGLRDDHTED